MEALDKDALICDFAQYYNIYDYLQYGVTKAAIYAYGLPEDSRIKKKIQNRSYDMATFWQVAVIDVLKGFRYSFEKCHYKSVEKPESTLDALTGRMNENDNASFESKEEFEAAVRKAKGN